MINITLNSDGIQRAEHYLKIAGKAGQIAVMRALNRTSQAMRAFAPRVLRERYATLTTGDIKATITTTKASASNLQGGISSRGSRLPLIRFARETGNGVRVQVNHATILDHAFIATMPSGHRGVFERKGPKRLPIKQHFTNSVPEFMAAREVAERIEEQAIEVFDKRFDHEIERALND